MKDYAYSKYPKIMAYAETSKKVQEESRRGFLWVHRRGKKTAEAEPVCVWHNLSIYVWRVILYRNTS